MDEDFARVVSWDLGAWVGVVACFQKLDVEGEVGAGQAEGNLPVFPVDRDGLRGHFRAFKDPGDEEGFAAERDFGGGEVLGVRAEFGGARCDGNFHFFAVARRSGGAVGGGFRVQHPRFWAGEEERVFVGVFDFDRGGEGGVRDGLFVAEGFLEQGEREADFCAEVWFFWLGGGGKNQFVISGRAGESDFFAFADLHEIFFLREGGYRAPREQNEEARMDADDPEFFPARAVIGKKSSDQVDCQQDRQGSTAGEREQSEASGGGRENGDDAFEVAFFDFVDVQRALFESSEKHQSHRGQEEGDRPAGGGKKTDDARKRHGVFGRCHEMVCKKLSKEGRCFSTRDFSPFILKNQVLSGSGTMAARMASDFPCRGTSNAGRFPTEKDHPFRRAAKSSWVIGAAPI